MEYTKNSYKKYLKSIYIPTLELIIDEIVDNQEDVTSNKVWTRDFLRNNKESFTWMIDREIVHELDSSKITKESHKEYVNGILEYKSPPTDKENKKEINKDICI